MLKPISSSNIYDQWQTGTLQASERSGLQANQLLCTHPVGLNPFCKPLSPKAFTLQLETAAKLQSYKVVIK